MFPGGRSLLSIRITSRLFLALVFVLALTVFVNAAEGWVQVRSKNFLLIGDAPEREIRQTALRLEQFRESLHILIPQLRLDGGIRTNVVVFKDTASFTPFKPRRTDGTADGIVKGYFQAGEDVNYIALSIGNDAGAYGTIFHEYVHFLLDINIGRSDLPPWLGEGLAEYFETLRFVDGQNIILGTPPPGHLGVLKRSELIPFNTFLSTDNSALHRGSDETRTLFYAQAWALVHQLLNAGEKSSADAFASLLDPARRAEKIAAAVHSAVSLRKYIEQPTIPTRALKPAKTPDPEAAMTVSPLSEAQAAAYLGDLLYRTGRLSEAEARLRYALKLDAGLEAANMSLGLLLASRKGFPEAKKYLEKAIDADRTNHYAYFSYAYAVSRESMDSDGNVSEFPAADAAKMREALDRAIALHPGFAESYRLRAFIELVNGTDLEAAAAFLRKGLTLRPGDQHLNSMLATVLLRQEKYAEAAVLAKKLSATAADASVWSEAQSVLRTVEQYYAAKAAGPAGSDSEKLFGPLPPLILKRSTLTESDVARYEEDRLVTNLNLFVDRLRFGEKQVVGYVEKITCREDEISYAVLSGDEKISLLSIGFGDLRLKVLTEGEKSFTLDCGVSFQGQLAVLNYRPIAGNSAAAGRLVSISFVPDYFRLKTPEELANRRTIIIEDDRLFRSRSGKVAAPSRPR